MPRQSKYLIYLFPFAILSVGFIFVPIVSVLVNSMQQNGQFVGLANYIDLLSNAYYRIGLTNSLTLASLSVIIGIVVSFVAAWLIHTSRGRFRTFFVNIVNMTSNFQGIQLAFSFMILLGNAGVMVLIGQKIGFRPLAEYDLYTSAGILATFVYFQIPLGTLLMYPAFAAVREEYRDAAEILGCTGFSFWKNIGIPLLRPALLGTISILFANAMAAYATPYAVLGSNYPLLAIQISTMFTGDLVQQVDKGSALCVLLMLFTVVVSALGRAVAPVQGRRKALGKDE